MHFVAPGQVVKSAHRHARERGYPLSLKTFAREFTGDGFTYILQIVSNSGRNLNDACAAWLRNKGIQPRA
jgi:hypothetical protein